MNEFNKLAKYPVFTVEHVEKIVGNKKTAYSLLLRLMKNGLVEKIRNNIYSVINPATGQLVASKYQIACAITKTAYISHHSAFEYYGMANQVFYEVYVSSKTKFNHFEHNNITYKYVASRMNEGIVLARNSSDVRITDIERTVIDSIRDVNKIGGFEELLNCLKRVYYLDEKMLKHYLEIYDTQSLFQRTGFLLNQYRNQMQLSEEFIEFCKSRVGRSRGYLVSEAKDNSFYNDEWELMIPTGIFDDTDQGGNPIV